LAQMTQDADVENQHEKFGVGGRHDHAGRRQTPLSAQRVDKSSLALI
jgi:hypothetical protein